MPDSEPDLRFEITGPDEDGFVWLQSLPGALKPWGFNLGKRDDAAEAMSQWLGSIDYGERLPSNLKPIKPMPVRNAPPKDPA